MGGLIHGRVWTKVEWAKGGIEDATVPDEHLRELRREGLIE